MFDKILSLSMRPMYFSDLLGQEELLKSLETQFSTGRIPHFFILIGNSGCGKTTLARLLSVYLQFKRKELHITRDEYSRYKKYDIKEINAANHNGVEDMRKLIDTMKFQPINSKYNKVVILDEAHQLTQPAQNVLLAATEDVSDYVHYIFCTTNIKKIIPQLQRRAYIIKLDGLKKIDMQTLIEKAKVSAGYPGVIDDLLNTLYLHDVTSPGLILQAAEKFFSGSSAEECVNIDITEINTLDFCRFLYDGNWVECRKKLEKITKSDVAVLRGCALGYLRSILLKSTGVTAQKLCKAISILANVSMEDTVCLSTFAAAVCLSCIEFSNVPSQATKKIKI